MIANLTKTKFIALDLEMEQPSGQVIQVGIAWEHACEIKRMAFYITPCEPVSEFIQELCGISDADFDWDKTREECFKEFTDFLKVLKTEDTFNEFVVWGQGDMRSLSQSLNELGMSLHTETGMSERRSIDVKTICMFNDLVYRGTPVKRLSLNSAMTRNKVSPAAGAHQADIDAENTLVLWMHLITRQVMMISGIESAAKHLRQV